MAKKKKKSNVKTIIIASAVLAVLLIGFIFLIGEVAVCPEGAKLAEKINDKDDYNAVYILDTVTISEGLIPIGHVVYYDSIGEANDGAKEMKESRDYYASLVGIDADDLKIRARGKAVFYGNEEALKVFNGIIF